MDFEFEKILSKPLLALRISGSHYDTPKDWKWLLKYILFKIHFGFVSYFYLYNFIYVNLGAKEFTEACRNAVFFMSSLSITVEYIVLVVYQVVYKSIMTIMKNDLDDAKSLPQHEKEIVRKYAKKGNIVGMHFFNLWFYGVLFFHLKFLFLNLYYYCIGEPRLVPLYDITYTPSIEKLKDEWWMIIILHYFLTLYGVFSSIICIAFLPLGPIFMLHAAGRLELAASRMEKLFDDNPSEEEVNKRLKAIVMSLQQTYEFVNKIEKCLKLFYEGTLKVSSLTLPVTAYVLVESFKRGTVAMDFVGFIISSIINSGFPCYYGDLVSEKGERVRLATYCCGWERGSSRTARNTLLIILIRTSHPTVVRTTFRTLSLVSLTDVFHHSYAIFSLLNAVWG